MNDPHLTPGDAVRRVLVAVLASVLLLASLLSAFVFMFVMNLGAHGPSFGAFLVELWPLVAAAASGGLALQWAARGRTGLGALAMAIGLLAFAGLWWTILK